MIDKNEKEFWKWFLKNKFKIESFMESDFSDYSIYNQLKKEIKRYDSILVPELTKTEMDEYVLIITPNGNKDGMEPVRRLFDNHPKIENWIIKKFRQPCDDIRLNFDGIEYPSSDIQIIPILEDEKKFDLRIFVRNLDIDEKRYKSLAFLYLDHILGEFNSISKIRYIDFYHLGIDKFVEDGISLLELRKLIEEKLY